MVSDKKKIFFHIFPIQADVRRDPWDRAIIGPMGII